MKKIVKAYNHLNNKIEEHLVKVDGYIADGMYVKPTKPAANDENMQDDKNETNEEEQADGPKNNEE